MTKTLTEQWKDGSFEFGVYYCQTRDDGILKLELCHEGDGHGYAYCYGEEECYRYEYIEEVLAPVPSYEEYKDLYDSNKQLMTHIKTCEQQIEKLQEQLKEANEVIKTTNRLSGNIDLSQMVYEDRRKIDGITMQTESYLKKWGVK